MKHLIRVEYRGLTFGMCATEGVIDRAAPVARWAIRKPMNEVVKYWRQRDAKCSVVGVT